MQTFPGHYVKLRKSYFQPQKEQPQPKFDDKYVDPLDLKHKQSKLNTGNDEFKINYEKIWPKHIRNQKQMKKLAEEKLNDAVSKNLIALASFPGSGNTWLRYLLQQATGKIPKKPLKFI